MHVHRMLSLSHFSRICVSMRFTANGGNCESREPATTKKVAKQWLMGGNWLPPPVATTKKVSKQGPMGGNCLPPPVAVTKKVAK